MVRRFVLPSGVVAALMLSGSLWAGHAQYPYPCPTPCTPNSTGWGYYPTKWRQWPGERLEQINPKAVGGEVIPKPEGQEQVAPPAAGLPGQGVPGGEILPPTGTILPPQGAAPPQASPPGFAQPPADGGMPGLPVEPGQDTPPRLPPSGPPKEQPKPIELPKPKGTIKPPSGEKSQAAIEREGKEWFTIAAPQNRPEGQQGTVVMLVDRQDPTGNGSASATHRAQTISVIAPTAPTSGVETAAYALAEAAPPSQPESTDTAAPAIPTAPSRSTNASGAVPAVAMGGYCPVELIRYGRWTPGDLRWTVVHNGWIYRLSSPTARQQFMSNPDRMTPTYSGNDPVLMVNEHRTVLGAVRYCATYDGRLYMFSSLATQLQFNKDPQRYATR
jgi:YHS domain-containing protein